MHRRAAGWPADRPAGSSPVAGAVSYSDEARLLGVPADLIEAHGAVSPEVARAMADGARAAPEADGVGVTGVAGPDGGTPAKPVGFVCLCVTTSSGIVLARDLRLPGNRADVRDRPSTPGRTSCCARPGARASPRRPRRPVARCVLTGVPAAGSRVFTPRAPYGSPRACAVQRGASVG